MITPLRILLLLLACTSFLALPAHAQKLPDTITTITVDAVQSDAIHVTKVGGTDMLQDKDVKRFIAAWNSLKTRPGDNHCATHPEYRLCFYQTSSKVYGYVAICFACHAIFRLDSENPDHFQDELLFNDDSAAKELHEMLSRMFPGHEARK